MNNIKLPSTADYKKEIPQTGCQRGRDGEVVVHNEPRVNRKTEDIQLLLEAIPANCSYNEWFRVAAALKNEGYNYEVFRAWSASSEEKYDEQSCERLWESVGNCEKNIITIGTLKYLAKMHGFNNLQTSCNEIPSELPLPENKEEMILQTTQFIATLFGGNDHFQLVTKTGTNDKGKAFPLRSKDNLWKVPGSLEEWRILEEKLSALIDSSTQGAWITFNPARKELAKSAVGEEDITQYNYILVEADEISKEQQWKKLHLLDLPIETIVWSGGKSYHALVKIDAGNDRELFKKRTKLLYNYLEQKGFPADASNKNASRLTRVPGFIRNGEMQYIAAWESGPSSWQEFEEKHLNKNTSVQAEQDPLQEQYGEPLSYTKNGDVSELNQNYFAAYTMTTKKLVYSDGFYWQYDPKTGIWNQVQENQMNNLIGESIREYGKKCGLNLARKVTAAVCRSIRAFMAPERNDPFKNKRTRYIHVGNGMLVLSNDGTFTSQPFSPDFYSRNQCKINYDPDAKCPRFINELLSPAISPEDIALLQLYAGQCLLGDNFTQTFLLLTGTAGGGKGTVVKIIEGIIGKENHAQLRTELLGERFELGRFIGKTLLTGPDVPSDFLLKKHAGMIKSLCGHDSLTAEIKGVQGGVQLQGRFNMIITANDRLKLNVDGDAAAWKRRVLWIPYQNPPVKNKIDNFDLLLIQEEGAGILNWMLEGAAKLLSSGIPKNTKAQQRIENLLQESDSVYGFLNCRIEKAKGSSLTAEALYGEYESWCNRNQWTAFPMRLANGKLREGIMSIFQIPQSHDLEYWGRITRGYHGIRIKREYSADTPDTEKEVSSIHENIQEASIQGELFFTT